MILPVVSALDIDSESPNSVEVNEEFLVSINIDSSDTFDVKIFVHNSQDSEVTRGEYISEIFNGEQWQDSWNYIPEAFPQSSEFKVRVTESGGMEICVRLRKTDTQTTYLNCAPIEVSAAEKIEERKEESESGNVRGLTQENSEEKFVNKKSDFIPLNSQPQVAPIQEEAQRIILNSVSNSESQKILQTNHQKKRLWLVYSLTVFAVILIILLALRKL